MMKTICILLFSTICFIPIACTTNSTEPIDDGIPQPDVDVVLLFSDESGNDLLNPNNPGSWNKNNIDIYHLIDGEKKKIFNPNLNHPKHFNIVYNEEQNRYEMLLWLSPHVENNYTVTYVEFPTGETDTLKIHAEKKPNGVVRANKFWYNEDLLFDKEEINYTSVGYYEFTKSVN